MIEQLRRILDEMGYELAAPELLDVLWLARTINQAASTDSRPTSQAPAAEPTPSQGKTLPPSDLADLIALDSLGTGPSPRNAAAKRSRQPRPHSLFAPDGAPGAAGSVPARAVRAPAPRALPGIHALARALRPLRDYRDHRHRRVVDIEATVRLTAETGILDVMDRPEQELRHTALLLIDDTPSMRLWQPLAREMRGLLERGGVFHSVQVHRIDPRSGRRPPTVPRTESPITFLLSDGIDDAWRTESARRFFAAWERNGPLVVLPPLPRRLWRGTAFETRPQLVAAQNLFAPLGKLTVLDPLENLPVEPTGFALPLPVAALMPASLNTWARMLTRPGTSHLMETALTATLPAPADHDASEASHSPERLLERFRASFSPDAYRLVVRLSTIRPLSTPVIQLVRIATLPDTTSAVAAEVMLSGLLQEMDEHDSPSRQFPEAAIGRESTLYDFRPGVRDLLASGLSTEQSLDTLEAVGEALEPYLGRMPDLAALIADPRGNTRLSSASTAFAVMASPVFERLYGLTDAMTEGPAVHVTPAPSIRLRFTLFGPVLAWADDKPFPIGNALHQAVLATLLAQASSVTPRSELIYAIRVSEKSYQGVEHLDTCISQLQQIFLDNGPTIVAVQDGYTLQPQEPNTVIEVDLANSEHLHEAARAAHAAGNLATAQRLMRDALRYCETTPLAGLPDEYAPALRARLIEWRLLLLESRIGLDLALGPPADVIAELTALVNEYPIHEPFRALLMTAYYRGGERDKALALHSETTRYLLDRHGVAPSRELRQLRERILAGVRPEDVLASPEQLAEIQSMSPALPISNVPHVSEQWSREESAALRFSVLGPVRAWRGAEALPMGSPQQRALLAALLLREGRTATAGELIDALWGDEPPSQALAAVRTYASRLRKVLSPGVLVSESGGYAIRLSDASGPDGPGGTLDVAVVQELAADAERARTAGDLSHARALLNKALDLWDGEVLANVPGPYAETQRARLEEWQLQLTETRLDMDLEQGRYAEAVSELTALTAAHPLRERLRELLMLALYRSGRQAEALAAYADTRRLLADELGVDPSPDLQELQQRILRADPGLAEPSAPLVPPEVAATPVRPAQLPATVPDFTGRTSFVSELSDVLATAEGRVMAVSALAGIGGVGKTTLAVHVAHRSRSVFPDGQLYVDLQGAGARAAEPQAVLGAFLRALGTADSAIPDTLEERAALYRSVLDGRRVLVLLDNARDAAQVRPLLPGTEGCAALVTSRVRMVDLAGAHLVDLDVMSPEEALQLFTKIVGAERVASERQSALDVVAACGFLPQAIRIAASRLAARRTWTVSVLAAKLADERRRLDELQAGDLAVKATFELGYGQLEAAQARAFRLLGLADGPDISLAAAAAVLDLSPEDTEDVLESLVDTSLLESAAPGRYRYHDLVRLYARACAERDEQPPSERAAALSRLLDFYLATAAGVYAIERPGDRLVDHLETTQYPGLRFTEGSAALDWLYTEAAPLLACVRQSTGTERLRRAVDLLWASRDLAESGANSHQYETTAGAMCDATRTAGDARAEGRARTTLTNVLLVSGRIQQAAEQAQLAMDLATSAQDVMAMSFAANDLGLTCLHQEQFASGKPYFEQAIQGYGAIGNRPLEALSLCNLSRAHLGMGNTDKAVEIAQRALATYLEIGKTLRLANGHFTLGIALTRAGRHAEALSQFSDALAVFGSHRQRLWEGTTNFRMAEVHLAARRPAQAAQHAEQALALGCIGGDRMQGTVLTLLGRALTMLGQVDRARACWREALNLLKSNGGAAQAEEVRALLTPVTAA